MRLAPYVLAALILASQSLFASPCGSADEPILLEGVFIVHPESGRVSQASSVLLRDGMVARITKAAEDALTTATRPAVSGYYLTPALHDAHVHIFDERDLEMYALYGVQTVRNMDGWPWHLSLRQAETDADRPRARLLTAGSQLERPLIKGAEDALSFVAAEQALGYDWVKLYDGLPGEALQALEASRDLRFTGHLPSQVPLPEVLATGVYDDIAHAEELTHALGKAYPEGEAGLNALATAMVESGVALTTTIVNNQMIAEQVAEFDTNLARSVVADAPPLLQAFWRSPTNPWKRPRDEQSVAGLSRQVQKLKALAAGLHARGVTLIAGTDAPNPTTVPGASLHLELSLLVDAGLTPAESLQTATSNAAEHLDRRSRGAGIEEGSSASFLVTQRNPLEDVRALSNFQALVIGGRWFSHDDVESLRNRLRSEYARDLKVLSEFAPDSPDGVFAAMEQSGEATPISREGLTSLVWFYVKIGNLPAAEQVARRLGKAYPGERSESVVEYAVTLSGQ